MKHGGRVLFLAAWVTMAAWPFSVNAQESGSIVKLESPLGPQATISFRIQTDKDYHTGQRVKPVAIDVLDIPGVGKVRFSQSATVCELRWLWARRVKADNLGVQIPGLPGPEAYFIQYTWDAPAGRFTGYVNGTALRLSEIRLLPWDVPEGTEVRLADGPFKTDLVSAEARYLDETQARAQVPEAMRGKHAELFGVQEKEPAPIEAASRLGKLLYESALDAPGSIEGWVMEGPGVAAFGDHPGALVPGTALIVLLG